MLKYFKMFIGIMHIYIISYNVQANPPTTPPESLFRIDSRTSHAIFQTGFISHGDNFNFYQHTYGQSNIVSSLDGRPPNDGWISSSLSEERSISYLRDRIESGMFQPGTYWLYEFTPPSGSYSFEITVEEALARYHRGEQNFNNAELEALNTFSTYFNMGEWLVRSHIPSNYISSAIPITIDEDGDIVYGETEINAAFDSGIPSFATLDPLMELGRIYDETSDNSIAGVANFGDSTPASFMLCDINSSRRINNTGNCSAIKKPPHIVTRHQADTLLNNVSARNSDLKINYYGRQYCLKPNSYFYVDYCEYTPMGRFTSEGQIQFNDENSNNIAWCVTMPSNVESSNFTWDYLRIDLCDINNDYQKFKLDPNSFELTSVISGVKVQIWEWYLIAAKPGYYGYDFSFKKQGNIKFGTTPYFRQEEININYQKDGQVWYPKSNDSGTIDSTNNSQRNFHDTGSDQIKQKFGDSILCLQEDSIKGPGINSVSWSECSKTSTSQKCFLKKTKMEVI
ncbi:hypothetical protein AT251_23220 [Enterovibrio nigricans]|nr:DUF1561 family protein [Enterovibrio nigricans]PKF48837.1 hypothetical protein AT251_23220 [Enterovibrio nigricans]